MIETLVEKSFALARRRIGAFPFVSFLFLLVIFISFSIALKESIPLLEAVPLLSLAVMGLIAGWLLARSGLHGWLSFLLAVTLNDLAVVITAAELLSPIIYLVRELFLIIVQVLRWPWNGPPDLTVLGGLASAILSGASETAFEAFRWLIAADGGTFSPENPAPAILWMFATIAAAIWASWAVRRREQPLVAILPAGVILAAVLNISRTGAILLLPFMLASLALIGYVAYKARESNWERNHLDYPESIQFDFTLSMIAIIGILSVASALAPAVSVRSIVATARRIFAEEIEQTGSFAEAVGIVPHPPAGPAPAVRPIPQLPRLHLLGSDPALSRDIAMIVHLETSRGPAGLVPGSLPPTYYWRGVTYDVYNSRGWTTSEVSTKSYAASQQVPHVAYPHLQVLQQRIHTTTDLENRLYAAGTFLTADDDFQVESRPASDMFGALIESADYAATSMVNTVAESQLHASSQDYPDWVSQRYLDLPPDIPDRVIQLAHSLVEDQSSPLDQARAIESYLRSFPYTLEVPEPPPDRDVSDYFLFDLQEGYCDYYATAMVVLSRAVGLPARLVVGFASGLFDQENQRFIITAADAHSWVELYFPGYGWIEFEPTAGRSLIELPAAILDEELISQADQLAAAGAVNRGYLKWIFLPLGLLFIASVFAIAWLLADRWRLRRKDPALAVNSLYYRINLRAHQLEVPVSISDTPYEFMATMKGSLNSLLARYLDRESMASLNYNLTDLTHLYVRVSYSQATIQQEESWHAISAWYQIRFWLLLARLIHSASAFIRKFGVDLRS